MRQNGKRAVRAATLGTFKLENQMVPSVVGWMRDQGLAVKREFSVPWGICDLVGMKLNQKQVRRRLSLGQKRSVGPPLRLHILSKIPDAETGISITRAKLQHKLLGFLPIDYLEKELECLVRLKFISSPKRGQYQKLNGWAPLYRRIVAVELKLNRITEALVQASSNLSFTTESYIALPSALAHSLAKSNRTDEFRKKGVGILAVDQNSCRRLLYSNCAKVVSDEVLQAHCVERFWRTRDTSS